MDRDIYLKLLEKLSVVIPIIKNKINTAVSDVTINDTSIVDGGTAKIPAATFSIDGVTRYANNTEIQAATSDSKVITIGRINRAVFYGLAKAAGASTADENYNNGIYTDAAIDKILTLLGVSALIGRREASSTPAADISNNELFMYQGKIYKATSAITTADTITPGTNCTPTDLISIIGGS